MTQNVGAIKYTVEAETGDLLNAEKMVDKATEKMRQDFNKVDGAVKKTGTEFDRTSKKVQASSVKMTKSASGVKKGLATVCRFRYCFRRSIIGRCSWYFCVIDWYASSCVV